MERRGGEKRVGLEFGIVAQVDDVVRNNVENIKIVW